jgi:hypothetical protein
LQLPGIVVDDANAVRQGFETEAGTVGGYVGTGYRHDGNAEKGHQSIRFKPTLSAPGKYRVGITYTALSNRANKVPVVIHHADGETTVFVNQQQAPSGPFGIWKLNCPLGLFKILNGIC